MNYPSARRSSHVDVYQSHSRGQVKIADPYHWLESSSEETDIWVSEQSNLSRSFLDANPLRARLESEMVANVEYARCSPPKLQGDGRWYWLYNHGLQPQSVRYRSLDSNLPDFPENETSSPGEIFFDPNLLTADGTAAVITSAFSKCGKYWTYGVSHSGSDVCTLYTRETSQPFRQLDGHSEVQDRRLDDVVKFVKFSQVSWTHDSAGYFYQRFPSRQSFDSSQDPKGLEINQDENAFLCYHRLGTDQEQDVVVIKDSDNPLYMWQGHVSESNGQYLELSIRRDTSRKNKLWICDLNHHSIGPSMKWIKLVDAFEAAYNPVHFDDSDGRYYIRTNSNAPRYKLVYIQLSDPLLQVRDVIPEDVEAVLEDVEVVNKEFIVTIYRRNVKDEMHIFSLSGQHLHQICEDFVGSIELRVSGWNESWFYANLTSFTTPGEIWRYDFDSHGARRGDWKIWRRTNLANLDLMAYTTEQVWYESLDGTRIPMFIVQHKSSLRHQPSSTAVLYGYGGFSIAIQPTFSPANLTFLKHYGAIFAVANIRGGSEFGEAWHVAGARENKSNCFDDFIAAADFLVEEGYAGKGRVAINGASNGGLLVAACVNRAKPNTFGAAVIQVGVLDMLRFDQFTIGKAWTSDYGDPQSPDDFDFIYPISPLHNIPTDHGLPPILLQTADHDDRVVPLHSFKYAASLQHLAANNSQPLLISIDKKAGHGAGKGTLQRIKEQADKYGFIAQVMGLQWRDGN